MSSRFTLASQSEPAPVRTFGPPSASRTLLAAVALLGGLFAPGPAAFGQEVATAPVGAISVLVRGNGSDTLVSIPLPSSIEAQGTITQVTQSTETSATLATSLSGLTNNQFSGLHYVRITSGDKAGMYYTVSANTATELTVETVGDDLASITNGTTFKIYAHRTLNSLFPHDQALTGSNPLTSSLGTLGFQRRSQILLPDLQSIGTNLAPSSTYYFTASGWLNATAGNAPANDTILYPDNFITIRQPTSVPNDTQWAVTGVVTSDPQALIGATNNIRYQDTPLALMRPADVKLDISGLSSGFIQSANTLGFNRRDQLLVYDNPSRGLNLAPNKVFYMVGGNWLEATNGNANANSYVIPASAALILRKYQDTNSASSVAVNQLQVYNSDTMTWVSPSF